MNFFSLPAFLMLFLMYAFNKKLYTSCERMLTDIVILLKKLYKVLDKFPIGNVVLVS